MKLKLQVSKRKFSWSCSCTAHRGRYTQGGGGAFLELGWQKFIGCPVSSPLLATYYPGDEIDEASEILGGCTSTVRNDWGMFGPVELGLDMQVGAFDHFSVRWDGELSFISDDSYVFSTFADDGSRLWVADTNAPSMGAPIIDRWESCCVAFSSAPIYTAQVVDAWLVDGKGVGVV